MLGNTVPPSKVLLAVTGSQNVPPGSIDAALRYLGPEPVLVVLGDTTKVWVGAPNPNDILTPVEGRVALSLGGYGGLAGQAVPAGLAEWKGQDSVRVSTDWLGFRHVYVTHEEGWAAASTSALALAALGSRQPDKNALAVLGLMGWFVGSATAFDRVDVLAPGTTVELRDGRSRLTLTQEHAKALDANRSSRQSAEYAAALLRTSVGAFWDDHPDALLQLTGGLDSRILLAALPRARRAGIASLTLQTPNSEDLEIAARLSLNDGMRHEIINLDAIADLEAEEAYALVVRAAERVQCASDPLALAALSLAEGPLSTTTRLSGLGGEVVRGFYYFGPHLNLPVSRPQIRALARWRLFPNERAEDAAFSVSVKAREAVALDALYDVFRGLGPHWDTATDTFYLNQRMRRWAGVLASASASVRVVVNPMLDPRFIALGDSVHPRDKAGARYLSQILLALDEDLARLPLDGRAAPIIYANPSLSNGLRRSAGTAKKVGGKLRQRARRSGRAPAGGTALAELVIQAWRDKTALVEPVRGLGLIDPRWLADVLEGRHEPSSATVAFLVNLAVAASVNEAPRP